MVSNRASKPVLLVLDAGTSCDFILMDAICKPLAKICRVVLIAPDSSDRTSKAAAAIYWKVHTYKQSDCIFDVSPSLTSAPNAFSAVSTILRECPKLVTETLGMVKLIRQCLQDYAPNVVISHYSFFNGGITRDISIPVVILHYAPGFPHEEHPSINDTLMMRKSTTAQNERSWRSAFQSTVGLRVLLSTRNDVISRLKSLRLFRPLDMNDVENEVTKHLHVCCWPKGMIASKISPLGNTDRMIVMNAGIPLKCTKKTVKTKTRLREKVQKWIKKSTKPVCLFTLGSFVKKLTPKAVQKVVDSLSAYCILFLNMKVDDILVPSDALPVRGFVDYNWIVPKVGLVVFTGSVCLQYVCICNETPMVMVPQLPEQYFWARNYKKLTGTPYIYTRGSTLINIGALKFDKRRRIKIEADHCASTIFDMVRFIVLGVKPRDQGRTSERAVKQAEGYLRRPRA